MKPAEYGSFVAGWKSAFSAMGDHFETTDTRFDQRFAQAWVEFQEAREKRGEGSRMKRYQIYSAGMRVHPGKDIEYAKGEWVSYEDVEKRGSLVREPLEEVIRALIRSNSDRLECEIITLGIKKALRALDGGGTE